MGRDRGRDRDIDAFRQRNEGLKDIARHLGGFYSSTSISKVIFRFRVLHNRSHPIVPVQNRGCQDRRLMRTFLVVAWVIPVRIIPKEGLMLEVRLGFPEPTGHADQAVKEIAAKQLMRGYEKH